MKRLKIERYRNGLSMSSLKKKLRKEHSSAFKVLMQQQVLSTVSARSTILFLSLAGARGILDP